jgi:AraC-like DNA-binding protein
MPVGNKQDILLSKEAGKSFRTTGPFGLTDVNTNPEDCILSYCCFDCKSQETFFVSPDQEFLALCVNLYNPVHYKINNLPEGAILKNQYNLLYAPKETSCDFTVKPGNYKFLLFQFTPAYLRLCANDFPLLKDFLNDVRINVPALLCDKNLAITAEMATLIHEIFHNTYRGRTTQLYVGTKIFYILLKCLENVTTINIKAFLNISQSDIEKVEKARDYLLKNMQNSISTGFLANRIEMDERKLARIFKLIVGKPVHNFLVDERMKKARILLRDTNMLIKEIAVEVGYGKNPIVFAEIFKRKFGIAPSELRYIDPLNNMNTN